MTGSGTAVVVVNYGSHDLLRAHLVPLSAGLPDASVVVVDNPTSAGEARAVRQLCAQHGWQLVEPISNLGFGGGCNAGVELALRNGAQLLLLLNPDARIEPDAVRVLAGEVDADPLLAVAPVIRTGAGKVWFDGVDLCPADGAMRATRNRARGEQGWMWLTGAVLMLSAELWRRTGGFDERYFLYWEDVDFSRRILDAGGRLSVCRRAEAVHDEGGTQDGTAKSERYFHYNTRNRLLYAAIHLDPAARRQWLAASLAQGWAIARRAGGRRRLLTDPRPLRGAITGTLSGLSLAVRMPQAAPEPLRVMQSFPAPLPTTNPYNMLLRDALADQDGLHVLCFSWRGALLTRSPDVFHAHWPEVLVSAGRNELRKKIRQLLFLVFVTKMRCSGTAFVRTVHNLELPQGLSQTETRLLRLLDRMTDARIALNTQTPQSSGRVWAVIPHGHYRDWYQQGRSTAVPGRIAYVGRVRRYKCVDVLVRAFTALDDPRASLRVSGTPSSRELVRELQNLAGDDPRIELRFDFLDDEAFTGQVTSAQLVVLPYELMHNSGAVLAALSLDRPVLVPDNEVNELLAAEIGQQWVLRFRGELTAADLSGALGTAGEVLAAGGRPQLSARDWVHTGRAHRELYLRAREEVGRRGLLRRLGLAGEVTG